MQCTSTIVLQTTNLLSVQPLGGVEALDESGRVSDEERVAGRAREHAHHRQPDVRRALRGVASVPDTQHVGERLEQRPRVLLRPIGVLQTGAEINALSNRLHGASDEIIAPNGNVLCAFTM